MAQLPLVELGNPILRRKARTVSIRRMHTPAFTALMRDMFFTMRRVGGIGLAAPQIGRSLRLAVIEVRPTRLRPKAPRTAKLVIVNPRIVKRSPRKVKSWEGCLSLPGLRAVVLRHRWVEVSFLDERGVKQRVRATGLLAFVFQHEIDHLDGKVYIDRVRDTRTFMTLTEFARRR